MIVAEITTRAFKKNKAGTTLKYRCMYGPRKGQVRASPAACNAPVNAKKSAKMKQSRAARAGIQGVKSARTKRINPQSQRVARMNKPRS